MQDFPKKQVRFVGGPLNGKVEGVAYNPKNGLMIRSCFDDIPLGEQLGLYKGDMDSDEMHWVTVAGIKHSKDARECAKLSRKERT